MKTPPIRSSSLPPGPATLSRRTFLGGVLAAGAGVVLGRAGPASPWQIGCYTRPWGNQDYRVALDGIAAAGFAFAGLMTAKGGILVQPETPGEQIAAMRAEAQSRGLGIASIYGGNFLSKPDVAQGVAGLRRLIEHSAACGCPQLLLGGTSRPEWVEPYYQAVAECGDHAAARSVTLTVKPHGGTNATGPECRRLIERVGHRSFGLWYDPGNIFYYSDGRLDPVEDALTVSGLVRGMSIKDFRPPKEVNLTPGTGRVDFPKVLARLRQGGFTQGPLIVECLNPGSAAEVTAEAKKARTFLADLTR